MNRSLADFLVLGALLASGPACAAATQTARYQVIMSDGHVGGEQVVERADDGWTTVHFHYRENGRGPDIEERFKLAGDGTFAVLDVSGTVTMGSPIDEHFTRQGNEARWSATSEHGSIAIEGSGLYVPLSNSFEFGALSVAAVAARADGRLPLIPSGTLTQRVIDEVDVESAGQRRHVRLFAQTGLGLTPNLLWMTDEATPRLFAAIYPGIVTVIPQEWRPVAATLEARQRDAEARLLVQIATEKRQPLKGLTVVRNARIFDSASARLLPASDIYILRGRISAIRLAGSDKTPVDGEIDAGGRIALPGLFDMHSHFGRWDGGLDLAAGVTTVRDMGNNNAELQQIMDERAAGTLLAPQIVACGFLEGDSPSAAHLGIVIKTLPEARAAVDWYADHGYPQLKIYNSFPKALVRETVAYAHAKGMRVSGHVPAFMRAQDVVDQGYDEIQHINQVLLNFLVTPTTDTRTLDRFYLPAEKVAGLDFDSPAVRAFLALLVRHKTVIDPTVVTFDFIKERNGEVPEPYAAIIRHLPPDLQRGMLVADMKIPDDATAQRYRKSYAKMVEFVGRMYRAGVPLVAGTDGFAGFTLHSELVAYVRGAGIPAPQVLQIATRNAALYSRTSADRGSLEPGKLADIVLVDGDPTTRIEDIRNVALVITQASVLSPSAIYQGLGVAPFVANEPTLRPVTAAR
jgi:imidazolonepropionase-like amidohydrolase